MHGADRSDGPDDEVQRLSEAAGLVSNKWHPAILYVLSRHGPARFNDLKGRLGSVSAKVLTDSLEKLIDDDLVSRRVLSESPRRVEYDLTARGEDMRPVIDALLSWSRDHLAGERPTVLLADDDPRIATMHAEWLSDRYRVETVYDADAAIESAAGTDVAVLDRSMNGTELELFGRIRDRADAGVVALTSTQPGLELVDLEVDEYLTKPVDPETLRETVAGVLERREEPRDRREYRALAAKRSAILDGTSAAQRADSDRYDRLTARLSELEDRIDGDAGSGTVDESGTRP